MATNRLGDGPIEPEYATQMRAIALALDETFNGTLKGTARQTGFVLLVFKFGQEGRCNFVSNGAEREHIVTLFKEMIARFEGQPEMRGHA